MGKHNKTKHNKIKPEHLFFNKAAEKYKDYKGAYLPNERANYHPNDEDLISTAPNGDITPLPNPASDPIVCNNIAWLEFDYTQSMADEMKNLEDVEGKSTDIHDKKTR